MRAELVEVARPVGDRLGVDHIVRRRAEGENEADQGNDEIQLQPEQGMREKMIATTISASHGRARARAEVRGCELTSRCTISLSRPA
jgi:hypothetical protein